MDNKNLSDEFWQTFKDKIVELIAQNSRPASEVLLDDVDLRVFLKISRRTALEYRKKGVFPYYKLDGKIFYILAEVIKGIKEKGGKHES